MDFQKLYFSSYTLHLRDDTNLISYLIGYFDGNTNDQQEFQEMIDGYLWSEFDIHPHFNTWIEQVDHYAFIKGLSFFDGFYSLINELKKLESIPKIKISEPEPSSPILEIYENLEYISVGNVSIKIGDTIVTSDKIGNSYKKTKFYNANIRNPSWELFQPSPEYDFKHIDFLPGSEFGKLWRIFSNFSFKVKEIISYENGKVYLISDIVKVDIHHAIKEAEVHKSISEVLEKDRDISNHISKCIEQYSMGIITKQEFQNQINPCWTNQILTYKWCNYTKSRSVNPNSSTYSNWCKIK